MKLFFSLAAITVAFTAVLSCSQQDEIEESPNFDLPIKAYFTGQDGDTINFASFESELLTFWETGLEEYSLEIFCSCECEGVFAAQNMLNDHRGLLPSILKSECQLDLPCDSLKQFMSLDCNFQNREDYKQFIEDTLQANNYISDEEVALVLDILEDIENDSVNIAEYRQRWYGFNSESGIGNFYSALIIEITNSGYIFTDTLDPTGGGDDIQGLWNKVAGAAIGAVISVTVGVCYHGVLSGSEIVDAAAIGAIGGAVRSL